MRSVQGCVCTSGSVGGTAQVAAVASKQLKNGCLDRSETDMSKSVSFPLFGVSNTAYKENILTSAHTLISTVHLVVACACMAIAGAIHPREACDGHPRQVEVRLLHHLTLLHIVQCDRAVLMAGGQDFACKRAVA